MNHQTWQSRNSHPFRLAPGHALEIPWPISHTLLDSWVLCQQRRDAQKPDQIPPEKPEKPKQTIEAKRKKTHPKATNFKTLPLQKTCCWRSLVPKRNRRNTILLKKKRWISYITLQVVAPASRNLKHTPKFWSHDKPNDPPSDPRKLLLVERSSNAIWRKKHAKSHGRGVGDEHIYIYDLVLETQMKLLIYSGWSRWFLNLQPESATMNHESCWYDCFPKIIDTSTGQSKNCEDFLVAMLASQPEKKLFELGMLSDRIYGIPPAIFPWWNQPPPPERMMLRKVHLKVSQKIRGFPLFCKIFHIPRKRIFLAIRNRVWMEGSTVLYKQRKEPNCCWFCWKHIA